MAVKLAHPDRPRKARRISTLCLVLLALSAAIALGEAPRAEAYGAWRCNHWPMGQYCWGGSSERHNWTQGRLQNESGWVTQVCMIVEEFGGRHKGAKHNFCPTTIVDPGHAETWNFRYAYSSGWPLGAGGAQACVTCDATRTDFLNIWTG